jgi:hypothetical protein
MLSPFKRSAAVLSLASLGTATVLLGFLLAASGALPGAVVRADNLPVCGTAGTPCALGPNLEVVSITLPSSGPCAGGTLSLDMSATNPGLSFSGPTSTTCEPVSGTVTETITLSALNGYQIGDLSMSAICGVTGGNSLIISFGSHTLPCPTGAIGAVSDDVTFSPVSNQTFTFTLSNTAVAGGSSSSSLVAENFSLVAPVPEPKSLVLMLVGLGALAFVLGSRRSAQAGHLNARERVSGPSD